MSKRNTDAGAIMAIGILAGGLWPIGGEGEFIPRRKTPPAEYTPDQERKPKGIDRAAKRKAKKKATNWRKK